MWLSIRGSPLRLSGLPEDPLAEGKPQGNLRPLLTLALRALCTPELGHIHCLLPYFPFFLIKNKPRSTSSSREPRSPRLAGSFGSHTGAAMKEVPLHCCNPAAGLPKRGQKPLPFQALPALGSLCSRGMAGQCCGHSPGDRLRVPPCLGQGSCSDPRAAGVLHCQPYGQHHKHWL